MTKNREILLENGDKLELTPHILNLLRIKIIKITPYIKASYGKYYKLAWELGPGVWDCEEDKTKYKRRRDAIDAINKIIEKYPGVKSNEILPSHSALP